MRGAIAKAGYYDMASLRPLPPTLPLACEHDRLPGGYYMDANRQAKQYIARHKASGLTLLQVWAMARSVDGSGLRKSILLRLSTRISRNNPLHHALVTEAWCCE